MIGLLRKLKGRSVAELRERAAQALSAQLEFRGVAGVQSELSDRAFFALLDSSVAVRVGNSAQQLHTHFAARPSPAMFAGLRDGSTRVAFAEPRWDNARAAVIAAADRVLAGTFQLLGYRVLNFGQPINWHLDPVSGLVAPRTHWSRIPYLDASVVGDHKVTWEINRHQHFYTLGRAYQATGHAVYAEHFAEHISNWMNENPPKMGINWASSLEVAYRAISWMWALELFRDAAALTPALLARMMKFAQVHGSHLERYLSTYFSPNTHLTGEALGLLYLGTCLPELDAASRWRERGWSILAGETFKQIHSDGVYFEQTTYYHRYTLDIYLHAVMLARSNGITVPEPMLDRVRLLGASLANMTSANGTVPHIGDDDGGRLVLLEELLHDDVRASLAIASVVLDSPTLAAVAGTSTEEVLWTLGASGLGVADVHATSSLPSHGSRLFVNGGYAVMRDGWTNESLLAVIDCGPLGTMNCGHAHADTLSAEFSVRGCDVLVDPGTYSYTASVKDRDLFRHTAMHNTVTVDGHASSVPAGPFSWKIRTDAVVDGWWSGTLTDCLVAHHDGFMRLPAPSRHTRTVLFVRNRFWIVVDSLSGHGAYDAVAHWHTALGTQTQRVGPLQMQLERTHDGRNASVLIAAAGDVDAFDWNEEWVSHAYGVRALAPAGHMHSRREGPRMLITVICPNGDQLTSVRVVESSRGHAIAIRSDAVEDLVLVADIHGTASADGISMNGRLAFVRRMLDGRAPTAMALFGDNASLQMNGLSAETRDAVEATKIDGAWQAHGNGTVRS